MFSSDTYVNQSEVVFINGKLFRSNLLFQGRGIGALKKRINKEEEEEDLKDFLDISHPNQDTICGKVEKCSDTAVLLT